MKISTSHLILTGVLAAAVFASFSFTILPSLLPNPPTAFATFPGENGKIAFHRNGEIYVMNADGSGQTRLTNNNADDYFPSWSPDGTKIAFFSDRDGNGEIYVMNADGSGQTNISNHPARDIYPSWSPDGTKIAFTSTRGGGVGIYVMNADGSGQTNNPLAEGFRSDWSPDGTKIAFVREVDEESETGSGEIYVMNADGSGQTNISNHPAGDYNPSWSPDGRKIAFSSNRDFTNEVFVMNADGSGQTKLTNTRIFGGEPAWSPDGRKIVFVSVVSGSTANWEIYVMNADGSGQTNISNHPGSDGSPDWGSAPSSQPPEQDTTPPVLTVPEDIVINATSEQGTVVTYKVTAEDNVHGTAILEEDNTLTQDDDGGDIDISCNPASGSEFQIGETEVECTATDAAGNSVTESFMVTVNPPAPDTTPPIITVPGDMTVEATGPDGAQVSFEPEPSATDDVDGSVDVACDYNSGDTFPIGETVVTCSAEDAAGNSAEETFTVTVQDTTDPDVEITQVVDRRNRVLEEGDTTPTPYIRVTFEATDTVGVENTECSLDGQGFTSCTSPVVYDRLSRGTHEVTVRATDEADNTGEDRFLFTVGSPPSSSSAPPGRQ